MNRTSAIRLSLALLCGLAGGAYGCNSDDRHAASSTQSATPERVVRIAFSPATGSSLAFVGATASQSHEGRFDRFSGEIEVVNDSIEASRVSVRVELGNVSILPDELRAALSTPDYFDVARFPVATFRSTSIEQAIADGQTHMITGDLELHGITKQIRFPAAIALSPGGVRARADFVVDRKDFGLVATGQADDPIRDEVRVRFDVRAPVQ